MHLTIPHVPASALRRNPQRGSVVIFVLGIILLAAFLITRLMDRAAVELATESKAAKRADLRQEAFSALETSLAVLADESAVRSGLHEVAEGWDRPLERVSYAPGAGYTAEAVVADESGKLSLPVADEPALRAFLEAIGCPLTAQDRLTDALLAWTRPDYLAVESESDDSAYANAPLPFAAPRRALRSFAELRAIPVARELFFNEAGEWVELGRRFMAGASLFPFNASNINSAHPEVLLARGLDAAQVSAIMADRLNRATVGNFLGETPAPPGMGSEALCLHVIVTVRSGDRHCRLDAWVRPAGGGAIAPARSPVKTAEATPQAVTVQNNPRKRVDYPFEILELRENDGT